MPCGYGEDYVDNCIVAIFEAEGLSAKGDRYDQIYAHFFNFQDSQISRLIKFGVSGLADRTIWYTRR